MRLAHGRASLAEPCAVHRSAHAAAIEERNRTVLEPIWETDRRECRVRVNAGSGQGIAGLLRPRRRRVEQTVISPVGRPVRVVLGKDPCPPESGSRRQMNQGIFAIFLGQVLGQALGRHADGLGWRPKDLRCLRQRRTTATAHGRGRRAFPAAARCPCLMSGSPGHMWLHMSGVRPSRVRRPLPWRPHLGSGRPGCKITTRSTLRYARVNGDEADRSVRPMPSGTESLFPFTGRGFLLWSGNP